MSFQKLFANNCISQAYTFRPSYSKQLFESLKDFIKNRDANFKGFQSVLDVACGGGQLTSLLTQVTQQQPAKILGIDVSETQIAEAKRNNKSALIRYEVANAQRFPVVDASVDLITIANALHFLHVEKFYVECRRALKKIDCAALAVVCTALKGSKMSAAAALNGELNGELNELWLNYLFGDEFLGSFWAVDVLEYENWHDKLQPLGEKKQTFKFDYSHRYSLNALSQYIKSFHAYPIRLEKHPDVDVAEIFMQRIHEIMKRHNKHVEHDASLVKITYPQTLQIMPIL